MNGQDPTGIRADDANQNGMADPNNPEEDAIHALRALLLEDDRTEALALARRVDALTVQFEDDEALIRRVNPILGEAIRRKIRDSREEMIETLYPIIGQLVLRAVSEAIRDLARTIDARMRQTISPQSVARRVRAQVSGVSGADVMLRDALPFAISEIFVIHRQTGILLYHTSVQLNDQPDDPQANLDQIDDSDVVSGMLTAIQDFVRDAFGDPSDVETDRDLDEIQYGEASILLETARHAYIAVVADGVEPAGFRTRLRQCIVEFSLANEDRLAQFNGNIAGLNQVESSLSPLLASMPGREDLSEQEQRKERSSTLSQAIPYLLGLLAVTYLIWWIVTSIR